jgi:hypothetical protein
MVRVTKGAWNATDADSTILAADHDRREVTLQHTAGGSVFLGIGSAAVVGEGICLHSQATFLVISDARAQSAFRMRCPAGGTASGGFQTV